MLITVVVKTHASREGVEQQPDGTMQIRVHAAPVEGRANERVVNLLSKHFGVPKSSVRIVKGRSSRRKLIDVTGTRRTPAP